ncbi:MAG: hypothetical protein AB1529_00095 [Candidatus Micrarchaeota archaeon]
MSEIAALFGFLLPAAAFAGGAYLIFRAAGRLSPSGTLSGEVSCPKPVQAFVSGKAAAYSRLVVDFYQGGHAPWKNVLVLEKRAPFTVSGKEVGPDHADFRLSSPKVYVGYPAVEGGMIDELRHNLKQLQSMADFSGEVGPNESIPSEVLAPLMANPGIKAKLAPHMRKPLRISEYSLAEGARVSVLSDPAIRQGGKTLKGTVEFPLIITDDDSAASSAMREKALLSAGIGVFLVLFSILLLFFVLSAM